MRAPLKSRKFKVVCVETGISVKFCDTKKEAQAEAKFMSEYHRRDYVIEKI